jgi:hypothetical protein
VFCETRFFRNSAVSRNCETRETAKIAKLVPHFRETRKLLRSQFREIFAKQNFVKTLVQLHVKRQRKEATTLIYQLRDINNRSDKASEQC